MSTLETFHFELKKNTKTHNRYAQQVHADRILFVLLLHLHTHTHTTHTHTQNTMLTESKKRNLKIS